MLLISARSQTHTQHMHRHYQTCTHTFNMKTQPRLAREVAQTNHSQALLIRGRLGAEGVGAGLGCRGMEAPLPRRPLRSNQGPANPSLWDF